MEKHKIYYNADGWVCERYPYDIPIENESRYIEVDEATWERTLGCNNHFSWRVVDGRLYQQRYEETLEQEIIEELRDRRAEICFPVINRGQAWYATLTDNQRKELDNWYKQWLDVTKTKNEPLTPEWLVL